MKGVRQFLEAGNIGRCSEVNRKVKNIRKIRKKVFFIDRRSIPSCRTIQFHFEDRSEALSLEKYSYRPLILNEYHTDTSEYLEGL